jgi:hypothetical protein
VLGVRAGRRRFLQSIQQPSIGDAMENHRMQRVSAVGVAELVRRWRADAVHIRNLAAQRHLQAEQRAALLREADAADRQADWWADCLAALRC